MQKKTNIIFKKRSLENDYIYFSKTENNCFSQIGRVGGKQIIGLAEGCSKVKIIHEIIHALGFFHEQNRPDRDKYIKVLYENINEEMWTQFDKFTEWHHEDPPFEFSFNTLMLYNSDYFRIEDTHDYSMVTVQGDPFFFNHTGLTEVDIKRINTLYPKI